MKTKIIICLIVVGAITIFTLQKNVQKENLFLLENIDALTSDEGETGGGDHGEIDGTLEPYWELSKQKYWIGDMPYPTEIPCCKESTSPFSGCAKGLDRCRT